MTEAEWLACTDPKPMLEFLRSRARDRKLRLFAVACCRRIWHLLPGEQYRTLVEVAERHANGLASDEERAAAEHEFNFAHWDRTSGHNETVYGFAHEAVEQTALHNEGWQAARGACDQAPHAVGAATPRDGSPTWAAAQSGEAVVFPDEHRAVIRATTSIGR